MKVKHVVEAVLLAETWRHVTRSLVRGAWAPRRGETSPRSVLTEAQVREILGSPISSRKIAPRYGITGATVRAIRQGRTWKHLFQESA